MNEQAPSKKLDELIEYMEACALIARNGADIHSQSKELRHHADMATAVVEALRATGEPPSDEPSVMGGMLSQPRPPVPSGVQLIEWCVRQIQITCDGLNLDPAQWLNDSTAQSDSAQPPTEDVK